MSWTYNRRGSGGAATAAASPITASGEETLTLVRDLARIAQHLGELTAAARGRLAAWGTVTPHLQRAEALTADATRCLCHAAGTYAFNTTQLDTERRPASSEHFARLTDLRRTKSPVTRPMRQVIRFTSTARQTDLYREPPGRARPVARFDQSR